MKIRHVVIAGFVVASLAAIVLGKTYRQSQSTRYTSPPESVASNIAGDHVRVDYYAPSSHGRVIIGGLVPYGNTGANWATKVTTEKGLKIGDLTLPKGSYSIWTLPGANEWTLIINKQTGQFHLDYDAAQDFGRTKMSVKTLNDPVETFRIELRPNGGNQGTLALLWEKTEVSIPFTVLQ